MPIKFTNTAKALKIEWANEDATRTASFSVPKQANEADQVRALLAAVGFLATATGVIPTPATVRTGVTATPPELTLAKTAGSAPVPPGPSTGPRLQMMPPASLSDLPAGGLPPTSQGDLKWEDLPTTTVPQHLAQAWETIPPDEQGEW